MQQAAPVKAVAIVLLSIAFPPHFFYFRRNNALR
jgi:hypothetical protein